MATGRGAIVVLPTVAAGQQGPVAALVSAAGWASGLRRLLGHVWIVTPDGIVSSDELRRRASAAELAPNPSAAWHHRIPVVAKTAVKDVREWQRARRFHVDPSGPWDGYDVACVWQRHELFHGAGPRLARALGVPSVVFVPAPLVWQAKDWGVTRPGWGRWTELAGEQAPLRRADVVACGSKAVAVEIRRLGIDDRRIVITPTGVDPDVFGSPADGAAVRRRLRLEGRFVAGWVGSFRKFHALDQAVDAVAGLDDATLLLVGDGPERAHVEQLARSRGVDFRATGTVPHDEIPAHLAAMDVALVVASPDRSFHYSPLKLAEYLSVGVPVIAPRAGALPAQLHDDVDALLVAPGDRAELTAALRRLRDEPETRARLSRAAREAAHHWSWDRSAARVLDAAKEAEETPD
jgi:glycosyltransferase involved in cell wall biosynthesis